MNMKNMDMNNMKNMDMNNMETHEHKTHEKHVHEPNQHQPKTYDTTMNANRFSKLRPQLSVRLFKVNFPQVHSRLALQQLLPVAQRGNGPTHIEIANTKPVQL